MDLSAIFSCDSYQLCLDCVGHWGDWHSGNYAEVDSRKLLQAMDALNIAEEQASQCPLLVIQVVANPKP